jgi:hypothetical protein
VNEPSERERQEALATIRRIRWSAQFHKTLDNPSVPGGKVDMYILIDDETGDSLVSLAVPHGWRWLAEYVCMACHSPWELRPREIDADAKMAVAMNRAIKPFVDADDRIDARDVAVAAGIILTGYLSDLALDQRREIIPGIIARLSEMTR